MHSTVVFFCWKQCFFIDVIKPVKTLSYNKKRKIHRCEATTTNATTTKKCNQSELVHTLPTNRHITNQISLVTELREVPRSKTDFKAREIKPTLKNNTNEHQKLFLNKLKKKFRSDYRSVSAFSISSSSSEHCRRVRRDLFDKELKTVSFTTSYNSRQCF